MSSRKSAVLESPQTTIGAQDLLCIGGCSKSGFLRKQGTLERLFKFLKWRQKFVVLSRGCIYVFKDELATRPQSSFTLKLFVRTTRHDDGRVRWSFSLLPVDQGRGKTLLFACISEPERKEWMKFVKAEMVKAHKVTENSTGESRDEYVYLEKPVLEDEPAKKSKLAPKLPVDEEEIDDIDADDPGGEKDYTTIDDSMLDDRPPMPKPVTKKTPDKKKPIKPNFKPAAPNEKTEANTAAQKKASSLPASFNPNVVLRTAFEYKGSDRTEIESLLAQRPEGTYLVRKSRSDGKEVLSVNIDGCLKEFKIYTKDNTVTINHTDYFPSVEELIQNYMDHPLPKKATRLYRAYSVVDPRYIN
ncbi:SH3 domain-binding protein 2-like [Mercenaria mercenaria]|uniref:SH3 domain-binding protein 2-like n=1 Tax=Mercenaria mercenaria TaxID=6596 RepID=UPI00234EA7E9|nr:SH3 domain-binding protein 2-like [Mercenaria mercenaria]